MINNFLEKLSQVYECNYITGVDKKYVEETQQYNELFKDNEIFFRGILYVLKYFLEEKDSQELFLQIPMLNTLGNNASSRSDNYKELEAVCVNAMLLACSNQLKTNLSVSSIKDTKIGEHYFTNNSIIGNNKKSIERYWTIKESKNDIGIRPQEQNLPGEKHFSTTESIKLFEDNITKTFRIKQIPSNDIRNRERLSEDCRKIELFINHNFKLHYKNAIICGPRAMELNCVSSSYFDLPIEFCSGTLDSDNVSKYEILLVFKDYNYIKNIDAINNAFAIEGSRLKKVIYVGKSFESFITSSNKRKYSFSYRDIFHYFFKSKYPKIKFEYLIFPDLQKMSDNLKKFLLDQIFYNYQIDQKEEYINQLTSYVLYPFLWTSFKKINIDKIEDLLYDRYYFLTDEEIDAIKEYCEAIVAPQENPKCKKMLEIRQNMSCYVMPMAKKVFNDEVQKIIKDYNDNKNVILTDVILDSRSYLEKTKYMLNNGLSGTYTFMSYKPLPKLEKFFMDEFECYNSPYRKMLLDNKAIKKEFITQSNDLIDYYESQDIIELFNDEYEARPNNNVMYKLNDSIITSGNVIIFNYDEDTYELKNLSDIDEKELPIDIIYYETPPDFSHLMELYRNFPKGKNVFYFAKLWKEKLIDLYNNDYKQDLHKLVADIRLKKNLIKAIVSDNYQSQFPESIRTICSFLLNKKYIDEEEDHLILASASLVRKNSVKGVELKRELYDYLISKQKGNILSAIESNVADNNYSDEIIKDSLKEIKLKSIKLYQ